MDALPKMKNGTIEFYRFLFTLLIMTFHAQAFLGEENRIFPGGYIGVDFFFLVSGFLMAQSMGKARTPPPREGLPPKPSLFLNVRQPPFSPCTLYAGAYPL